MLELNKVYKQFSIYETITFFNDKNEPLFIYPIELDGVLYPIFRNIRNNINLETLEIKVEKDCSHDILKNHITKLNTKKILSFKNLKIIETDIMNSKLFNNMIGNTASVFNRNDSVELIRGINFIHEKTGKIFISVGTIMMSGVERDIYAIENTSNKRFYNIFLYNQAKGDLSK